MNSHPPVRIALAGNPNTGKTSLFNCLTGSDQKVGNYPGITVDRHTGYLDLPKAGRVELVDVPGCYSLSARSPEEQIAINTLAGLGSQGSPDVVVLVVDATQLRRNLYLALQVLELEQPCVIALNMVDMLDESEDGNPVRAEKLAQTLDVPVVSTVARSQSGLSDLREAIDKVLANPSLGTPGPRWAHEDPLLQADLQAVMAALPDEGTEQNSQRKLALAAWALLSLDDGDELVGISDDLRQAVNHRRRLAAGSGRDIDEQLIEARYAWIDKHVACATRPQGNVLSERIDSLLLNPLTGFLALIAIMGILFQTVFTWSGPMMDWIDGGLAWIADAARDTLPEGILRSFVTEGLIAGTGAVLVFLPQIMLLFAFMGVMEDSGYMSRVAFLMDRIMKSIGLHGRAFIPMLAGYACAIPAVMATRTMERRRDRLLTMMVVPLMSCAARLPVYALVIGALFPVGEGTGWIGTQGLLLVGMYLFSTLVALIAAGVLSRTLIQGPRVPLLLELPAYRLPQPRVVGRMVWQKGKVFVSEAGTIILACTIVLWLLLDYPGLGAEWTTPLDTQAASIAQSDQTPSEREESLAKIDHQRQALQRRHSYAGKLGRFIEPAIAPLGFDWKIGVGLIGSFAAREVFVATLGVVYGSGGADDEAAVESLRHSMRDDLRDDGTPVYTPLVGISLLVFFALACQCLSTVAVVKRETHGYRWPCFMLTYMTALAWGASFLVYQGGLALGLG